MNAGTVAARLKVLMTIHLALIMGVLMFVGVVLAMQPSATVAGNTLLVLRVVCVSLLATGVMASIMLRNISVQKLARSSAAMNEEALLNGFAALSIIRAALAEGPALFGAVLFFVSDDMTDLILVAGGLALLVATMPMRSKWERFSEDVQRARV